MKTYKAALRDIAFVNEELLAMEQHYQKFPQFSELNQELSQAIINEAAKFAEKTLAPLNPVGDEQGCSLEDGRVTTPEGFAQAYKDYVEGGWPGLSMPEEFGGQGLPKSMDISVSALFSEANHAWAMYPGLSAGCRATLLAHGSEEQVETYLPNLVSGEWTGTMCLTEPQCGSDLSFLKTKAIPEADGSYTLTGTKIFISSGDHDMSDNIVHLVLARLPDAPAGTKGISLFIVPKFLPDADGGSGERNSVTCGSLEHKMGIHGNATCVMNFDGAKGFLIGEANKGLRCMFTFMNSARLGVALEGACHSEVALQGATRYALERSAGRSLTGVKFPESSADLLIVHPDVRKMILTIRSFAEGGRAMISYLSQLVDFELYGNDDQKKEASELLSLLTPIAKGFLTETGIESANLGMQVYGGHGYIAEWGMEQNMRDARISAMYEGTTGIQALDLLGRKVLSNGGKEYSRFIEIVKSDLDKIPTAFAKPLKNRLQEWQALTGLIAQSSAKNLDEIGAASVDYMMYSGYVVLAWLWAKMAMIADNKLASDDAENIYRIKTATAKFYFDRVLPRASSHREMIESGAASMMELDNEAGYWLAQ